jgi:hypothetical protein
MKLLALIIAAASLIAAPRLAKAETKLPDKVLEHIRNEKYVSAWEALPHAEYKNPAPGIAFNVAFYFDKRASGLLQHSAPKPTSEEAPTAEMTTQEAHNAWLSAPLTASPLRYGKIKPRIHDRLAAVYGYRIFLEVAPNSDIAPSVKKRIGVLLNEFNTHILAQVKLLENLFRETQKMHTELHNRPQSRRGKKFDVTMAKDRNFLEKEVFNLATIRIYLGDVEGGLALLREFSIDRKPSDHIMMALIMRDEDSKAKSFGSRKEHKEISQIYESILEGDGKACPTAERRVAFIKRLNGLLKKFGGKYFHELDGDAIDSLIKINTTDTYVWAERYENYAWPLRDLALQWRLLDLIGEFCVGWK